MASNQVYLDFVLEQLSELDGITSRKMMGEYILYYQGKIFGGIYDDRFLVKPVEAAKKLLPDLIEETPYPGGKKMLLVEEIEDKIFLSQLIKAMYEELPEPKKKKAK